MWRGSLLLAVVLAVVGQDFYPASLRTPVAVDKGGTGLATLGDDSVVVGDSATAATARAIPNCGEAGTLNYTTATNTFSCLTDGGGGGGGNFVEVSLPLSTGGGLTYRTTVTGQAWVTTSSVIVCSPFGTIADGQTIETTEAAGFSVTVSNRVDMTGFDLAVYSPHGATGTFRVHCTGA